MHIVFPSQVLRSQLRVGNAETTVLDNFYNIQYYTTIAVGTPGQLEKVLMDTGSGLLWMPSCQCTNCGTQTSGFNETNSLTFNGLKEKNKVSYLKGSAMGNMGEDFVTFQNFKVYTKFMVAQQVTNMTGSQFDGIMGLSNDNRYTNVFDIGYKNQILASSAFAFRLGLRYLKEKSYFYYNITRDDFPNAFYVPTSQHNKWMIPVKGFYVEDIKYDISNVLIDTGTSLILLPPKQYQQLVKNVFDKICEPYPQTGLRVCSCYGIYPNLTFLSSGIQFNITPSMYILGQNQGNKRCYLGLQNSQSSISILGDNFLQHNTIIFDKQAQEIGFIGNYRQLLHYIIDPSVVTVYKGLQVVMVIAIGMFCWGVVVNQKGVQLRERINQEVGQDGGKGKDFGREIQIV